MHLVHTGVRKKSIIVVTKAHTSAQCTTKKKENNQRGSENTKCNDNKEEIEMENNHLIASAPKQDIVLVYTVFS